MSSQLSQPLLDGQIEPDEAEAPPPPASNNAARAPPVVLTPTYNTDHNAAESGITGILKSSSHPGALAWLYVLRIAAVGWYLFSGFVTRNYVLSSVLVVVLLSMDFWNARNVAGRRLVGLRFWNQVDEDGASYWVFECRDPSRPANPIDSRMFWIAIYVFPLLWFALLIVSLLRLKVEFVPIVILALVFNCTNAIGFTYADRDAKLRAANSLTSGWGLGGLSSLGGIGGQLLSGAVQKSVGRVFGA
ncbi:Golgi apparatus membrane protein TVP23 [Mycena chlorophos]|uniref:Golgi apparatus membrane protein TVP23 n=1 Tax=Mycena chlorophos TaxID=658473 RepID=A0A8H6RY76_MYCCL|nr:Golgi apparatus membrane protein TVP23 [Mycena chlorophos]